MNYAPSFSLKAFWGRHCTRIYAGWTSACRNPEPDHSLKPIGDPVLDLKISSPNYEDLKKRGPLIYGNRNNQCRRNFHFILAKPFVIFAPIPAVHIRMPCLQLFTACGKSLNHRRMHGNGSPIPVAICKARYESRAVWGCGKLIDLESLAEIALT